MRPLNQKEIAKASARKLAITIRWVGDDSSNARVVYATPDDALAEVAAELDEMFKYSETYDDSEDEVEDGCPGCGTLECEEYQLNCELSRRIPVTNIDGSSSDFTLSKESAEIINRTLEDAGLMNLDDRSMIQKAVIKQGPIDFVKMLNQKRMPVKPK